MQNIFVRVFNFYYYGFKNMSNMSKKLWMIILIKLFIMFAVLKLFFFPNFLKEKAGSDKKAQSEYVGQQLIDRRAK